MEPENQPTTPVSSSATDARPVTESQPLPQSAPAGAVVNGRPTSTSPKKMGTNKNKLLTIIAVIMIVLLGGSAAAYFGVVVPSKPDYKLRKAFLNLASKKQISATGQFDYANKKTDSSVKGFTANYTLDADLEKSNFGLSGTVGISGAQFPFDFRSVDKDMYVKIGGLNSVDKLFPAGSLDPSTAAYLQLASTISDNWYVIDRSYLQEAGVSSSCVADLSFALNNQDVDKIDAAYKKYPLFKVKGTSKEKVDNVDTTKMELEPASDETANKFANELTALSVVKKVKDCLKDSGVSDKVDQEVEASKESGENAKIYAYVTNDKQLKKLELTTEDANSTGKFTMLLNDTAAAITKPEGAKPIQELLGGLLGNLYGSTGSNAQQSAQCAQAYEDWANSRGSVTLPAECR